MTVLLNIIICAIKLTDLERILYKYYKKNHTFNKVIPLILYTLLHYIVIILITIYQQEQSYAGVIFSEIFIILTAIRSDTLIRGINE